MAGNRARALEQARKDRQGLGVATILEVGVSLIGTPVRHSRADARSLFDKKERSRMAGMFAPGPRPLALTASSRWIELRSQFAH